MVFDPIDFGTNTSMVVINDLFSGMTGVHVDYIDLNGTIQKDLIKHVLIMCHCFSPIYLLIAIHVC